LLDALFITFDEFQTADAGVRATLQLFLSGVLVMPFENTSLTIQPVPLIILNPREAHVGRQARIVGSPNPARDHREL
jgi:hypothetical protein